MICLFIRSKSVVGAKNVNDLVLNHVLNLGTSNREVLSGVECAGLLAEYAADTCGHSKTDIGVDVDLTYCHGSCLTELLLGDTYCVRKSAAEGVDLLNELLRNGGSTVKNDWELGKTLSDLLENVKAERRRNENTLCVTSALLSGELVSSVGGTDRDSERVNACASNELLNLFGTCIRGMLSNYIVFNACENSELTLNDNAVSVCIFNNLLGEGDVVLEGMMRAVDHNGREASVDAGLADLEICAVVEVKREVDAAVLDSGLSESEKVSVLSVLSCTCGNLKDNGGFYFARSLGDSLNNFHVIDVESTDSVAACVSLLEHLFGCNKCHF